MKYLLKNATINNMDYLKKTKLYNIFNYAHNLPKQEIEMINKYVDKHIPMQVENYKMIIVNNQIVGCVLVEKKDDGVILDEIYLEKEYRNKGIGTSIIENIKSKNRIVYLWVYKENKKAVLLYEKLEFKVVEESDIRFYMKFEG